jgi:two-component system sensor kinase FixL
VQRMREWLKHGKLHSEALRVSDLAEDVLALVRADAAEKRVTLDCAVPPTLPLVAGDRVHLSQVLLNLIMNAMDALAKSSEPRRQVVITARVGPSRYCEVSVSDSGPGIPPNKLAQIFEPFFTDKADGMGIGLSISRTIVEAHGGRLWAENGDDGGATFRFTVPLYAAEFACSA